MSALIPKSLKLGARVMMFVDGKNLAIRFGQVLNGSSPADHVLYRPRVYAWSQFLRGALHRWELIRIYYFTSIEGDGDTIAEVEDSLIAFGIEAPRVFKKSKTRQSKRVDISLTTEMLNHSHRGNFDAAVLVSGDEDYVPLVEAVKGDGHRLIIWSIAKGTSPHLRKSADFYFDIAPILLTPEPECMGINLRKVASLSNARPAKHAPPAHPAQQCLP